MLTAILFDLDGTLVNTDPIHFRLWQDMLLPYGLDIDRAFYNRRISGGTNDAILQDILPQLSAEERLEFADKKEALFRESGEQLERLAGLNEILHWCQSLALKKAVVTNAPELNAIFMLDALGLTDTFPIVILGEEASAGKPDPAPYSLALERLEVKVEEAIAFEDSPSGVRSAVAAGVYTIGVASTHDPEHLLEVGAKRTIADFTEPWLWEWLEELVRQK